MAAAEGMYRLLSAGPRDDVSGVRLGRFVVQRWLGAGGFGVVFLAHDELLRRDVALKLPQARELARAEVRERFLREAEAAAQLYHPNVVPVFEAGEEQGVCYIASAYCPGPTLDTWLVERDEPVPVSVAISLVRQLARAVAHAHTQRVLHRDIKPSNILLEPSSGTALGFTPKLTDFGLAKIIDADTQMTGSHCLMGTPRYMAPEQATSNASSIGPAADVFALGAVLYELLTGIAPHAGDDYARTLHRLLYEPPKPPRELRPEIPRDLEAILLKCLEKRPEHRYAAARDLAEDLRRFQEGRATRARPIGRLENLRRWMVRQPAVASLLVVIAVAVLSLLGILVAHNRSLEEFNSHIQTALRHTRKAQATVEAQRSRLGGLLYTSRIQSAHQAVEENDLRQAARLLAEVRSETPALADDFVWRYLWSRAAATGREIDDCDGSAIYDLVFSASGSRLAGCGADGLLRIYDGASFLPLASWPCGQGELNSAVFSPDERSVATAGDDGTVRVWDIDTQALRATIQAHSRLAYGVVFTPDGQSLITCGREPIIRAWDLATGDSLGTFEGHSRDVEAIALSPDGTHLASASCDDTVRIWHLESRSSMRVLRGHSERVVDVQFSPDGEYLLSGSIDQTVRLWRVADGESLQTDTHLDAVASVSFVGDHRRWVVGDRGGSIHVGQHQSGNLSPDDVAPLLPGWIGHQGRVWEVAARNGCEVITAGADGRIRFWGKPSLALEPVQVTAPQIIHDAAFDPQAEGMHFSISQRGVENWSFVSQRRTQSAELQSRRATALCVLPNQVLVICDAQGAIEGLDLTTQRTRFRIEAAGVDVKEGHTELMASTDGRRLAWYGRHLGRVDVYDLPQATLVARFTVKNSSQSAALSSDGRRLAMSNDDRVVLWDVDGQQRIAELGTSGNSIRALAFSPDGRYLASGSGDRRIRLWPLDGRNPGMQTLDGHRAAIGALTFSPDGRLLASGDENGDLKFWWLQQGTELLTLSTAKPARELLFSHDGSRLAQLSWREIQVFDAPSAAPFPGAEALLPPGEPFLPPAGWSAADALASSPPRGASSHPNSQPHSQPGKIMLVGE